MTPSSGAGATNRVQRRQRRRVIAIAILLILVVAVFAYVWEADRQLLTAPRNPTPLANTTASLTFDLSRAANYLLENYNSSVGLIPETPGADTYWLYSDNFLAGRALSQYAKGNATVSAVAQNITRTVARDSATVGTDNQYALAFAGAEPCQFHTAVNYNVSSSEGALIRTTLNNGPGYLSEYNFTDIAFLTAICLYPENHSGAIQAYKEGLMTFDGIGFEDLPYNQTHVYQTYKLALCVLAAEYIGQPVDLDVFDTMLQMQAPSGGFYTGYVSNYSTNGTLTNTETTSLAMMAIASYLQG